MRDISQQNQLNPCCCVFPGWACARSPSHSLRGLTGIAQAPPFPGVSQVAKAWGKAVRIALGYQVSAISHPCHGVKFWPLGRWGGCGFPKLPMQQGTCHRMQVCSKWCWQPFCRGSAISLSFKERLKEAEEVYKAGIENCPESSDLHNNYGVFLVDTGKWEGARDFSLSAFFALIYFIQQYTSKKVSKASKAIDVPPW